ncbi:MAG TPA: hypothetical protein VHZ28_10325 [Terracidiphilus sp.]|nr:hypothetical protein [Terracidiphilus sp.]
MNTARTLAIAAFTMASLPLLAQQPGAATQQPDTTSPAQTQQQMAPPPSAPATSAPAAAAEMSTVNGELVDKLDTKTAKTGDPVVIKTRSNVKTADGTDIPKGSKLVGKVMGVKPIGAGNENSQVALQFDHVELKGGQNMPVHAELQALSTTDDSSTSSTPETMSPSPSGGGSAPSASPSAPSGSMGGSSAAAAPAQTPSQPQTSSNGAAPASAGAPAAGTVVARTGNISIKTTSIPGVLLATNEPGQQDPRMAQSSGILLGPKHDIHLDGGTKVVVGVATAGASAAGHGN